MCIFRVLVFKLFYISTIILISAQVKDNQTDSSQTFNTINLTSKIQEKKRVQRKKNPSLAGLYSAVFPGLGQYYNRAQWWKFPVYYALIGGGAYFIKTEHMDYKRLRKAFLIRIQGGKDEFDGRISTRNLILEMDDAEKDRNLAIVFTGIFYVLNILDAVVEAHLSQFQVDENLSLSPQIINFPQLGTTASLRINIKF